MLSILRKYLTTRPTTESLEKILATAESERIAAPTINTERCDGCSECAVACPVRALEFKKEGTEPSLLIMGELCIRCGRCIESCTKGALSYGFLLPVAARDKAEFRQIYQMQQGGFTLVRQVTTVKKDFPEVNDIGKLLQRSLHFRELDSGSCNACEVEVNMLTATYYDVERFGICSTASPRFADAVLITGPVTRNMKDACEMTYKAVPTPKIVVAMGSCAISGGIFRGGYAVNDGAESVMPVDVFIPGCPPSPQALIYGLLLGMNAI